MIKSYFVLPCAVVLAGMSASAFAASGTVHFRGELTQGSCQVSSDTQDQTVYLGRYSTTEFTAVGDTTASKSFNIDVTNCDPGTYTIRFDGPNPQNQPDLLAVDAGYTGGDTDQSGNPITESADASTSASGVGIEVLNNEDQPFPIGGAAQGGNLANFTIEEGGNGSASGGTAYSINLKARYKSYADEVTAGQANADATFSIQYL